MTEQRRAEAGATWQSEPIFQEKIGNPITRPRRTQTAVYAGAQVKGAAHPCKSTRLFPCRMKT
jgi:hypothetical protein